MNNQKKNTEEYVSVTFTCKFDKVYLTSDTFRLLGTFYKSQLITNIQHQHIWRYVVFTVQEGNLKSN